MKKFADKTVEHVEQSNIEKGTSMDIAKSTKNSIKPEAKNDNWSLPPENITSATPKKHY